MGCINLSVTFLQRGEGLGGSETTTARPGPDRHLAATSRAGLAVGLLKRATTRLTSCLPHLLDRQKHKRAWPVPWQPGLAGCQARCQDKQTYENHKQNDWAVEISENAVLSWTAPHPPPYEPLRKHRVTVKMLSLAPLNINVVLILLFRSTLRTALFGTIAVVR